jgi:hypothetical protein
MIEILRKEFETRPAGAIVESADALGDPDLALADLRRMVSGRSQNYEDYWALWTAPYSAMRTLPGYKALMRETGLADYWRQTGDWGDVCRPVGDDDFECK